MARRKHTFRWWDGEHYRQETFNTKAEKDDFMAEIRKRRRLGLPLTFERAEPDPRLDVFVEDYWRLHAVPNLDVMTRRTYLQQWDHWIRPRLGAFTLDVLNARLINRQLVEPMRRAGAGDPTIRSVLAVLQSVLALAVAEDRLASNPVARVRKPRQGQGRQVAPVAPVTVEQLRARMRARDAMLISVLAYAGLRPEEALALDVAAVGPRSLFVHRKVVDGQVLEYTKTRRHRAVELLTPLGQDLREYMLATGVRRGLLFARRDGGAWRKHDYDNWRTRIWQPAAAAVGLGAWMERPGKAALYRGANPYDLRGSWVSLMAWEGRTMLEVARMAGHSLQTCDRHYAGIFEGTDPAHRTSAEEAIRAARQARAESAI